MNILKIDFDGYVTLPNGMATMAAGISRKNEDGAMVPTGLTFEAHEYGVIARCEGRSRIIPWRRVLSADLLPDVPAPAPTATTTPAKAK